jgi:hypothetical protein
MTHILCQTHFFRTNKSKRAVPSYGKRIRAIWQTVCILSLFCSLEDREGYVILSVRELFCCNWNDRNFIKLGLQRVKPGYRNRYSESLRIGRSGIESPRGREFLQPSTPALGPPSHLYNGYWVSFPGLTRPGLGEYSYTSSLPLDLYGLF